MPHNTSTPAWLFFSMLAGLLGCLWWWHHSPPLITHQYLVTTLQQFLRYGHPSVLALQVNSLDAITQLPITQWPTLDIWLSYLPQPLGLGERINQGLSQQIVFWTFMALGLMGLLRSMERLYQLSLFQVGCLVAALLVSPALAFPIQLGNATQAALFACWGIILWLFCSRWCRASQRHSSLRTDYYRLRKHSAWQWLPSVDIHQAWVALLWSTTLWLGGTDFGVLCFMASGALLAFAASQWNIQLWFHTPGRRPLSVAHWQWLIATGLLAISLPILLNLSLYIINGITHNTLLSAGWELPATLLKQAAINILFWPNALSKTVSQSIHFPWLTALGWGLWAILPLLTVALMAATNPQTMPARQQHTTRWRWISRLTGLWCLTLSLLLFPITPWAYLCIGVLTCAATLPAISPTSPYSAWTTRILDVVTGLVLLIGIGWLLFVFYRLGDLYPGSHWHGWGTPSLDVMPMLFPVPIAIWKWWLVPLSMGCIGLAGLLYWAQTRTEVWIKLASLWMCAIVLWSSWFGTIAPTFSRSFSLPQMASVNLHTRNQVSWLSHVSSGVLHQLTPNLVTKLSHPSNATNRTLANFVQLELTQENQYLQRSPQERKNYRPLLQWRPYPLTAIPRGTQWGLFPVPFWQTQTALLAAPRIMLVAKNRQGTMDNNPFIVH